MPAILTLTTLLRAANKHGAILTIQIPNGATNSAQIINPGATNRLPTKALLTNKLILGNKAQDNKVLPKINIQDKELQINKDLDQINNKAQDNGAALTNLDQTTKIDLEAQDPDQDPIKVQADPAQAPTKVQDPTIHNLTLITEDLTNQVQADQDPVDQVAQDLITTILTFKEVIISQVDQAQVAQASRDQAQITSNKDKDQISSGTKVDQIINSDSREVLTRIDQSKETNQAELGEKVVEYLKLLISFPFI